MFLWSVRALLLVLHYRQMDPTFLLPDAENPKSHAFYAEARTKLIAAGLAVDGCDTAGETDDAGQETHRKSRAPTRRAGRVSKAHPLIPDIVTAALDYIDREGKAPGVVKQIAGISGG